ncbi:hypothetical protein C9374_007548 [Naegleria lovaniensis]|uniref:F-box domain-containing protein n=1 Tax=Naegleria lovaniensis TaxID=51637 RepID=A0AA88KLX6_NAELO|nr:uncharacterized protein C9374_007548 [Naegleria lovaniensis]KAG2379409.1 hypothetical protein C9374_007548 [Naegleria lovaniensis]
MLPDDKELFGEKPLNKRKLNNEESCESDDEEEDSNSEQESQDSDEDSLQLKEYLTNAINNNYIYRDEDPVKTNPNFVPGGTLKTLLNEQPEEVIELILSFMPIHKCVGCSRVSRKFRQVWLRMPCGIVATCEMQLAKYMNTHSDREVLLNSFVEMKGQALYMINRAFDKSEKEQRKKLHQKALEAGKIEVLKLMERAKISDPDRFEKVKHIFQKMQQYDVRDRHDYHRDTLIWYGKSLVIKFEKGGRIDYILKHYVDSGSGYNESEGDCTAGLLQSLGASKDDILWILNLIFDKKTVHYRLEGLIDAEEISW